MSVPFIVPNPHQGHTEAPGRVPADPVDTYLHRLGIGSRRGMADGLNTVASFLLGRPSNATELEWPSIRYNQTAALRGWLVTKYAPATTKRVLAAVRGVLKESWRLGLMSQDDYSRATDIASIRAEDEPRGRALTQDEIRKLFEICAEDSSIAGIRDPALLAILYGLGLRRSEVVALEIADYDAHNGTLAIHGKGDKPRVGYVLERVKLALDKWVEARGDWDGPLFPPLIKGGRISHRTITSEGLALIIRKRATEAGVEHFSLHDLRRTFITDLLTAGADLSIVQKLAGHRQLSTTLIYDRRGEGAKVEAAGMLTIPHF